MQSNPQQLCKNRQLGNYQVEITDRQQLIAQFQGTAHRKAVSLIDKERINR